MLKNRFISLTIFIVIWFIFSKINPILFADYSQIYQALISEIDSGFFYNLLLNSSIHFFPGIILGTILGILFGSLSAMNNFFGLLIQKTIISMRPIPPLAWTPFLIVGVGINHISAIILIIIGIFWIGFFQSFSGILSLDPKLKELALSCGVNKKEILIKIIIPQILPIISTILRLNFGQAIMFLIASELFGSEGIGLRIWESSGILAMDIVGLYLFVIIIIYHIFDYILEIIEQRIYKWRRF